MLDDLSGYLFEVAAVLINMPLNVSEKFFVVNLLAFIALAYLSYRLYYRGRERRSAGPVGKAKADAGKTTSGFFGFLFPRAVYFSRSARLDYGIFFINVLLSPLLLIGAGLQTWFSIQIGTGLVELNDGRAIVSGDWNTPTYLLFILGYTLAADLSVYIVHRVHHRSDVLWPLHRLHHSATVLTPVTLFRKHPLWNLTSNLASLTLTGVFQGVFVFFFFGGPEAEVLFGINTIYVLYNFFGANLRHSHVWLSWGKPLSYLFISPAMHQIHHDPARMNCNYGEVFAIWDWLFGSLYIPDEFETFDIGLGADEPNPHHSLVSAYGEPLIAFWQELKRKLPG